MKREEFLARVRQAAASGRRFRIAQHVPAAQPRDDTAAAPAAPGLPPPAEALADRFLAEVNAAGGRTVVADSWPQAQEALHQLLDTWRPAAALCWQHPHLERLAVEQALAMRGARYLDYRVLAQLAPEAARAAMLQADLGISAVHWALAETGTLVLCSAPGSERAASLLPPVHLAVVHQQQILWDLSPLVERFVPADLP
ncbi:MAG: lactate utilization protein, partial [Pirellulales bacterium]|nr:lactate utilization protein [Pirellulales bacterium]